MQLKKKLLGAGIAVALGAAGTASATTGYAPHGIGMKAKGMGGVGIAIAQDAVAGGMNPANMAWLGNRIDFGVDIFRPIRSADSDGTNGFFAGGTAGHFDGSETKLFFIPEFGYNLAVNNTMTLGVSVFGNGGMNSDYKTAIFSASGKETGIDLAQVFIVPTLSYKVNQNNSIGVGLNLVVQAFEANGMDAFGGLSSNSAKLSDNGHDYAYGAGVRLGWSGKVAPGVTVGATYQTRTYMTEFNDYKGLFAEQGDFDVPANFGVGVAFEATPDLTVALDYMRIQYSDVESIGNKMDCLPPFGGACTLGSNGGAGFGWKDQNVYKLGLAYQAQPDLMLRAGFVYGTAVIPSSQVLFNVVAPATVQKHLTLGATYTLANGGELTVSYMHAFEKSIAGTGNSTGVSIKMHQDSLGIAYGWKF